MQSIIKYHLDHCRPGHVTGARIETCAGRLLLVPGLRRPGHVTGARIETRLSWI